MTALKLKLKKDITPRQIAELHRELGLAHNILEKMICGRHHGLLAPGLDRVNRTVNDLGTMMLGLESYFVEKTSSASPFFSTENPNAWIEWLDLQDAYSR